MDKLINRKPVVSGRFYSADPLELESSLKEYFDKADYPEKTNFVNAIISPHAGYVYSGEVAASAFAYIDPDFEYENVFVLAPSHQLSFKGASIYNIGNYETPLGEVAVNINLANKLLNQSSTFSFYNEAHKNEHSLEVQLPFLQYWLKKPFKLVPIVIGTQDLSVLKKLSDSLLPYFTNKNLFVISSDFSHFPNYNDAIIADTLISEAILTKDVKAVENAIKKNKKSGIKNLATSACGISGIYTLLYLLEDKPDIQFEKIKYLNSGDSHFGDHSRVVGYLSFIASTKSYVDEFLLDDTDKEQLLSLARNAISSKLENNQNTELSSDNYSAKLHSNCGVFVSIHKKKELRGCVGRFISDDPLFELVQKMAISSAFYDTRFSPISINDLGDITIEISILSPLKEITNHEEIIIGKHGIYIKQGYKKGTLLPQVAVKNNWSVEEFLGYCSKHKTGIGWDGWKNAELYTYTAQIFKE
ncbi:MAG: AmmeMemoRadiSam system protein B [Salinivirgaceae bacterium]|jgi:AmmeMemoRadiSam system protein B/AmmeMemoRadiSam system protein A|nr:AmmeMemoRadiSam system protein B [Salinivirgaceae bacterium]